MLEGQTVVRGWRVLGGGGILCGEVLSVTLAFEQRPAQRSGCVMKVESMEFSGGYRKQGKEKSKGWIQGLGLEELVEWRWHWQEKGGTGSWLVGDRELGTWLQFWTFYCWYAYWKYPLCNGIHSSEFRRRMGLAIYIGLSMVFNQAIGENCLRHRWQTQGLWAKSSPVPCFIQPSTLFLSGGIPELLLNC